MKRVRSSVRLYSTSAASTSNITKPSLWSHLNVAPFDGNHETAQAYEADKSPLKVNLGRGVYKDDKGKDWPLPSVLKAVSQLSSTSSVKFDYLPFSGLAEFTKLSSSFLFGKSYLPGHIATIQTISGTGALRVGAEFLARFLPTDSSTLNYHIPRSVYLPDPTYVNHNPIFLNNSFQLKRYRYYDPKTCGLDLTGLLEDVSNAPERSVFLFHACAHNPTGVDPTLDQWKQISSVVKKKSHIVFFDIAYQGFASGDPDHDAAAVRLFVDEGHRDILVAQSYAKNMGLYGQRVGALNIVTENGEKETKAVMSQLNQVVRPMYSNPPGFGAQIVAKIFGDGELKKEWERDVKEMAGRIIAMRKGLVAGLKRLGSHRNWDHIEKQIGMFAYSGLSEQEVRRLREKHVFMNVDGRMSITGVNSGNLEYLAKSIHEVTSS